MTNRLIAIGDIHGCADSLNSLLHRLEPTESDTIVTLGDYVDRGPDSKYVIDMLIELQESTNLIPLRGNHEEMMLEVLNGAAPQRWLQHGGVDTLESYGFTGDFSCVPPSHQQFFDSMVDSHEADSSFFTHAAYHHELPLDDQPPDLLRWHSLRDGVPPPHVSEKTGFVGHTAHKGGEIKDFGHLVCLDTFCYGGGWLTAMDVNTRQVWQADITGASREL